MLKVGKIFDEVDFRFFLLRPCGCEIGARKEDLFQTEAKNLNLGSEARLSPFGANLCKLWFQQF